MFDYDYLPSVNVAGGVFCWDGIVVTGRCPMYPNVVFLLSSKAAQVERPENWWWITVVYGPQTDQDKVKFLEELLHFKNSVAGPWMVCGDFNMIYLAADKNNAHLD
jgi:hypothetical protein